jgi:hypothetical protein
MAKRHRTRPRQRRTADATHRAVAPRAEREVAPVARASTHRVVRGSRTGWSRAAGVASGTLTRAAVIERGFISKDFRRLAIVVGIALALLVIAGFAESALLGR